MYCIKRLNWFSPFSSSILYVELSSLVRDYDLQIYKLISPRRNLPGEKISVKSIATALSRDALEVKSTFYNL